MDFIKVCEEWEHEQLPIIKGILYSDGRVDKIYIDYDDNDKRVLVHNGSTTIDAMSIENDDLSDAVIYAKAASEENGITVYCGGGSYGGDGFVVAETADEKVLWIAFFEDSNEFERCEIVGSTIIAYNNSDEKWLFNIDTPSKLSVEQV